MRLAIALYAVAATVATVAHVATLPGLNLAHAFTALSAAFGG